MWASLGDVVTDRQSLVLALVAVAIALITYHVGKDQQVPAYFLWYALIAGAVCLYITMAALKQALAANRSPLPSVLTAVKDGPDDASPILLLEPSPLFGVSTMVALYHRDEATGYEILLGHGKVRTVQGDGKIQVKIDEWVNGNDAIRESVSRNEVGSLKSLVIRSSVERPKRNDELWDMMFEAAAHQAVTRVVANYPFAEGNIRPEESNE